MTAAKMTTELEASLMLDDMEDYTLSLGHYFYQEDIHLTNVEFLDSEETEEDFGPELLEELKNQYYERKISSDNRELN